MTQNRPPPAFQEYAANMMAKVEYRILTLPQRGLLYSMRLECWVNLALPETSSMLARVLGFSTEDVQSALPAVMRFFALQNGQIICPELEDYRAHLAGIRQKQKEGGKRGAKLVNSRRKPKSIQADSGDSEVDPQVTRTSTRGSSVKLSSVQVSQNQSSVKGINLNDNSTDQWIADYDRASNGG